MAKKKSNFPIVAFFMVFCALGFVVAYNYLRYASKNIDRVPRKFGQIKNDLAFVNQDGKKMKVSDLYGKVWVLNQIFTRCPSICPAQTAKLRTLQENLAKHSDEFALLSISVDPEYDTPERLRKFAQQFGVNFENWTWGTGEEQTVKKYLRKQFLLASQKAQSEEDRARDGIFVHSSYISLVDKNFEYRNVYRDEDIGSGKLQQDILMLLRE